MGKFHGGRPAFLFEWLELNPERLYASPILKSNLPEFKIEWIWSGLISAPVAQLDRACASEAQGRVFESLRAHHFKICPSRSSE